MTHEKQASDAPSRYNSEQADAWAAGYNAAIDGNDLIEVVVPGDAQSNAAPANHGTGESRLTSYGMDPSIVGDDRESMETQPAKESSPEAGSPPVFAQLPDRQLSDFAELKLLIDEYDPANSDWNFRRGVLLDILVRLWPQAALAPGNPGALSDDVLRETAERAKTAAAKVDEDARVDPTDLQKVYREPGNAHAPMAADIAQIIEAGYRNGKPWSDIAEDVLRELPGNGAVEADDRPHKTMTLDEYLAEPRLQGWHSVCFDVDGFGGVGVRYHGEPSSTDDRAEP
jgi:hypothetical protein